MKFSFWATLSILCISMGYVSIVGKLWMPVGWVCLAVGFAIATYCFKRIGAEHTAIRKARLEQMQADCDAELAKLDKIFDDHKAQQAKYESFLAAIERMDEQDQDNE